MLEKIKNRIGKNNITFEVKVIPNASKNYIDGTINIDEREILKIKVTKPPENGKANKAVLELLSKTLSISTSKIKIIKGETNHFKTILIEK